MPWTRRSASSSYHPRFCAAWLRRWAGLAPLLALALLTTPLPRALRTTCDLCPPQCPMHRAQGAHGDGSARHMHCHGAPPSAYGGRGTHRVSRPPCSQHGVVAGFVQAPMLLPAAFAWQVRPRRRLQPNLGPLTPERPADAPDTPPPIAAA